MSFKPKSQQGAALITALMILAICASLATFMLMNQRLLISQAILVRGGDRLSLMLQGVQDWAIDIVETKKDIHKVKSFNRDLNGIHIQGNIFALGGRFNINSLANTVNIPRFALLLQAVSKGMTKKQAQLIASNVSQWLQPSNHEDTDYLKLKPAYRSAHKPLVNISELRLIKGVNFKLYNQLVLGKQPYVSALPTTFNKVNINYASVPMLMSLGGLSVSSATSLIQCRNDVGYFDSVDDFIKQCASGKSLSQGLLTTENNYFLIDGEANLGEHRLHMTSLIKRYGVNNKMKAIIVWQQYNGE